MITLAIYDASEYNNKKIFTKNAWNEKYLLQTCLKHAIIPICETIKILAFSMKGKGQRPKGGTIRMNKYELALVVNAKIEDDARAAVVEKAKEYISRAGGTVTEVEDWGKKRLAYEIQKMSDGFFYFIQFDAEATAPAEIERHVRIMDNVLRFLCVRKDEA